MASAEQIQFFDNLLTQKEFPATREDGTPAPSPDQLRQAFAPLDTKSASAWIEKAMTLPDKGFTPPAF